MKRSVILTALSFLVLAQLGLAQVPQTINHQGVLRDASGDIVDDGDYTLTFKLWSAAEGGTELWSEAQSVPVIDGIFSAVLGVSETFSSTLADFESPLWLEMWIEAGPGVTGPEFLSPRIELTAVPYAIKSRGVAGSTNVFPSNGNVGIGTAAPGAKLHIASPNADGIALVDLNSGNWSAALLNWEGVGGQLSLLDGDEVPQVKIRGFASDGVQAYFTAGNVGIGTDSPQAMLHVAQGDWILGSSGYSDLAESALLTSFAGILYEAGGSDWAHHFSAYGAGDIARFGISTGVGLAPDSRVVIANSGNVGIGTTNPSKTLTVNSGSSTITGWFMGPEGGTELYVGSAEASGALVAIRSDASNNRGNIRLWGDTEANGITIVSGGNVGIGTTNPSAKLDVVGDANIQGNLVALGDVSTQGTLTALGDASVDGDLAVTGTITQGLQTEYYSFGVRDATSGGTGGSYNYVEAYYDTMAGGALNFAIPLHLPHGATITGITINVHDNAGAADANCKLYSMAITNFATLESALTSHADLSATGIGEHSASTPVSDYSVDNQVERFWLRITSGEPTVPSAFIRFYGGYITYTVN